MAKNQRMQFKMRKIQERYKGDKRRLQEETQAFYKREGYNPMSAGCSASMMLQFPIVFGLIAAIYRPLQYTVKIGKSALSVLQALVETGGVKDIKATKNASLMWQLNLVSHFNGFKEQVKDGWLQLSDAALDKLDFETLKQLVASGQLKFTDAASKVLAAAAKPELDPAEKLTQAQLWGRQLAELGDTKFDALQDVTGAFEVSGLMQSIETFLPHFHMGHIDLGTIPQTADSKWYILFPIFAGLASMASSLYTFIRSRRQNPEQSKNPMMGCMTFGMPLFSVFLAFGFPAGVAMYWIVSSLIAFLQLIVLSQTHKPAKMLAKLMVEETIQRRSRENSRRRITEMQQ
jgi:YidC/Oxa1 family membrane protein insertase